MASIKKFEDLHAGDYVYSMSFSMVAAPTVKSYKVAEELPLEYGVRTEDGRIMYFHPEVYFNEEIATKDANEDGITVVTTSKGKLLEVVKNGTSDTRVIEFVTELINNA